MTLREIINLYQSKDTNAITAWEESIDSEINEMDLAEVVDLPLVGNCHVDSVCSKGKNFSPATFLIRAFKELEYMPIEMLLEYQVQSYSFEKMIDELSFDESRNFIDRNVAVAQVVSVVKLREKDELTFFIETEGNFLLMIETYWKS